MIKFDSIFNSISGKEHVYCLKKMPLERMCNTVTIILYTYKSYIVLKKSFFFFKLLHIEQTIITRSIVS